MELGVRGRIDFYCSGGKEQFLFIIIIFFATRDGTYILYIILCPQYLICVPDQERVFHILV